MRKRSKKLKKHTMKRKLILLNGSIMLGTILFLFSCNDSNKQKGKTIFTEFLVKDWESTAIWPMSALPYIDIVSRVDKVKASYYLSQYTEQIEKYKTFIEVYTKKGVPYKSLFFSADEGMIWCANYLYLDKLLK